MFWSGAKIEEQGSSIIFPFEAAKIDCAGYTLSLGEEVYLTHEPGEKGFDEAPKRLSPGSNIGGLGDSIRIKPGQFAYLLTEETLKIPTNILGFISLRATFKWKGLVNISGFHVDPGYNGKLVYAVHNAGPQDIVVRRGEPLFLIWFSTLDRDSKKFAYKKPGLQSIDSKFLGQIDKEILSVGELSRKVQSLELQNKAFLMAGGTILTFIALIVAVFAALVAAPDTVARVFNRSPQNQTETVAIGSTSTRASNPDKTVGNSPIHPPR